MLEWSEIYDKNMTVVYYIYVHWYSFSGLNILSSLGFELEGNVNSPISLPLKLGLYFLVLLSGFTFWCYLLNLKYESSSLTGERPKDKEDLL